MSTTVRHLAPCCAHGGCGCGCHAAHQEIEAITASGDPWAAKKHLDINEYWHPTEQETP